MAQITIQDTQAHFNFGSADGTESGYTLGTDDADITPDVTSSDYDFFLRWEIDQPADGVLSNGSQQYQLQSRINSGTYYGIDDANCTWCQMVDHASLTQGNSCSTSRVGDSALAFEAVNYGVCDTQDYTSTAIIWSNNTPEHTEVMHSLRLLRAQLSDSDVVDFRLVRYNGGTPVTLYAYSVADATATITKSAGGDLGTTSASGVATATVVLGILAGMVASAVGLGTATAGLDNLKHATAAAAGVATATADAHLLKPVEATAAGQATTVVTPHLLKPLSAAADGAAGTTTDISHGEWSVIPAESDWAGDPSAGEWEYVSVEPGVYDVDWDGLLQTPYSILLQNNVWYLYFTAAKNWTSPDNRAVGVATSGHGISFEKYSGNPVVTHQPTLDPEEGAVSAAVLHDGSGWEMWFGSNTAVGGGEIDMAITHRDSSDGLTWSNEADVKSDSGYEYWPQTAYYHNSNYYVFYTCIDGCAGGAGGRGPLRVMWGTNPATLSSGDTEVDSGPWTHARYVSLNDDIGLLVLSRNDVDDTFNWYWFHKNDPTTLYGPLADKQIDWTGSTTHIGGEFYYDATTGEWRLWLVRWFPTNDSESVYLTAFMQSWMLAEGQAAASASAHITKGAATSAGGLGTASATLAIVGGGQVEGSASATGVGTASVVPTLKSEIGSVWASGTWVFGAWAKDTWADAAGGALGPTSAAGVGTASATLNVIRAGTAQADGVGVVTVSPGLYKHLTATADGVGSATAVLGATRALGSVQADGVGTATAILTSGGQASGNADAAGVGTATVSLNVIRSGEATAAGVGVASVGLDKWAHLTAQANGVGTATAVLTLEGGQVAGSATADGVGVATVTLAAIRDLGSVQADGVGSTTAALSAGLTRTAQADGVATVTVTPSLNLSANSDCAGVGTATVTLSLISSLTAQADGVGTATAVLTAGGLQNGTAQADGVGVATAVPGAIRSATTSADGTSTATVSLGLLRHTTAAPAGVGSASVTLNVVRAASAVAAGSGTASATLNALFSLTTQADGVATAEADLTATDASGVAAGKYAAEHAAALADVGAVSGFSEEHAQALLDIKEAGKTVAVSFTYTVPGTYDPATGVWTTPTTTTVAGNAMQVRGDPEVYKALSLIEAEAPTLLFVPTTYGEVPEPGYTVEWNSTDYTAKSVQPIAPDGVVIMAKVVVSK